MFVKENPDRKIYIYKILKFLAPRANSITSNEFTLQDIFALQKKLLNKILSLLWVL